MWGGGEKDVHFEVQWIMAATMHSFLILLTGNSIAGLLFFSTIPVVMGWGSS
jgi:hypothetical protein